MRGPWERRYYIPPSPPKNPFLWLSIPIPHIFWEWYINLAKPKSGARILVFPHVSRAQRLAPARSRTRVVRLGAQCTDHWTTGKSHGVGVRAVLLTTHAKSSALYGRMVVHPNFFGLMGYHYFV